MGEDSNKRKNKTHTGTHNRQNERKQNQDSPQSRTTNKIKCEQWRKNMEN